ncbi:hypothetical protein DKG74_07030 [Zavarzinia aquatilis]|uniref:Uncharacterized protein n=2 Tax=Zavarzinia aquatilis TaxID=2211142 RepID=A0A317ECV0_9PROT|nr:hypothetical protein DKG74_07030 [Zavarzinia aquatilis]
MDVGLFDSDEGSLPWMAVRWAVHAAASKAYYRAPKPERRRAYRMMRRWNNRAGAWAPISEVEIQGLAAGLGCRVEIRFIPLSEGGDDRKP